MSLNRNLTATLAILAILAAAMAADSAYGQAGPAQTVTGTLIVAHGGSAGWNARVREVAREVRTGGPVAVSFLMGPEASATRFQDEVAKLVSAGAGRIVVVPLLVSSRSGHYEQIRYLAGETDALDGVMMHHLHMAGIERRDWPVPVRVTSALDAAPELAAVLSDRARGVDGGRWGGLFLVAHGPDTMADEAVWMENLRIVADSVRVRTGHESVLVGLLRDDSGPGVRAEAVRRIREMIRLQHAATREPVLVLPIMISSGEITEVKVPADLADLPIVYRREPLLPHPQIARWIEARVLGAR